MFLAYLLTDEAYAVVITHYHQPGEATRKHWYFLGAGLTLWSTWQVSTAVGIILGAEVPASWSLDFTLPLTFIAIVVPTLKERAGVATAATAGIVAVLAAGLPFRLGLVVATLIGISIGMCLEPRDNKHVNTHKGEEQNVVQELSPTEQIELSPERPVRKDEVG